MTPQFLLLLTLFLTGTIQAPATAPKKFDAKLTETLIKMHETAVGSRELALLLGLTRDVPESFLENGVSFSLPNARAGNHDELAPIFGDPASHGKAIALNRGYVTFVEELPLSQEDQKKCLFPAVFRCQFAIDHYNRVEVLCAFVPDTWPRNTPMCERASTVGVRYRDPVFPQQVLTILADPEPVMTPEMLRQLRSPPIHRGVVAPRLKWFPDTLLGRTGFDVGSFEAVPPLSITDMNNDHFDLPPSLQHLSRQEILRRAFKITEADIRPFYGLLQTVQHPDFSRLALEQMEQETKRLPVVEELFTDPKQTRGKPVLLHGTAKRVVEMPVKDQEVRKLYGIDKFYEIYLFAPESQGNPMVLCTPSLPEGMPTGTDTDYSEQISVLAIPYKLVVYETGVPRQTGEGPKPHFGPMLVGAQPTWHPAEKQNGRFEMHLTWGLCAILVLVLIFVRRFFRHRQSRQKIAFKLS